MNELTISDGQRQVAETIQGVVQTLTGSQDNKFVKAYLQAQALATLNEVLTEEYFKPILSLKNKKVGFLTDEKPGEPYKEIVVRECIIEALLFGLSPYGNQFNILAGKMYPTREGYGGKLRDMGVKYKLYPALPKKEGDMVSVNYRKVLWEYQGKKCEETDIEFPIRVNKGMGDDAIMGKAERKILKWIYTQITNEDYGEGEVEDVTHEVVKTEIKKSDPVKAEDAVIVQDDTPKADPDKQAKADGYLDKATSLADLEVRIIQARKVPHFDEKHYNELKSKFLNPE